MRHKRRYGIFRPWMHLERDFINLKNFNSNPENLKKFKYFAKIEASIDDKDR